MNENSPAEGLAFHLNKLINLYELVFDAAIVGITVIIYHILAPGTGFLLIDTDPLLMLPIMGAAEFFIMLFFGQIFRVYNDTTLEKPKVLEVFSLIILFFAITMIFLMMPARLAAVFQNIPEIGDNVTFAFVPLSGVFVILGITIGFPRKYIKDCQPFLYIPIALTSLSGIISLLYVLFNFGIIPGILYFIVVGGALLVNRIVMWGPEPKEPKAPNPIFKPLRMIAGILLPVTVALSLMVWQELITVRAVQDAISAGETVTPWNIIFLLTVSGLIPVRILAILAPPFRPVNAGLAVISMLYYFSSLTAAINKLSALK